MTPHLRKHWFLLVFLCLNLSLVAQKEVDSLRFLIESSEGESKVNYLGALASRLQTISPVDAITTINESIKLAKEIGYIPGEIDGYIIKATVLSLTRKYTKADQEIKQALSLLQDNPDQLRLARSYLLRTTHEYRRSNYELANESAHSGLAIARSLGEKELEATFLNNLGHLYEEMGKLDFASDYLHQAYEAFSEIKDQFRLGQININLGVLEYKKHNLGLSIEYNQKALQIFQELGDKALTALSFQNLGFAHSELKDYQKALSFYSNALDISEEVGDVQVSSKIHLNKAKVYHSMGEERRVATTVKRALELAEDINDKRLLKDIHFFLHEFYSDQSDHELALKHYKLFVAEKDSISLKANEEKISEIRAQFEFDELTRENKAQAQQNEIKSLQINERNYVIGGLCVLVILIARIVMIQRKKFNIKFQLGEKSKLLAEKEAELVRVQLMAEKRHAINFMDQMRLKDEILLSTKAELIANQNRYELPNQSISSFIDKLNHSLEERDWSSFKLQFESIYPQFFERLNENDHPLGKNDDRLAAMIRIKLTNKEIASILNISPESVIKAKNRLKKKMGFDHYQQLEEYILKL